MLRVLEELGELGGLEDLEDMKGLGDQGERGGLGVDRCWPMTGTSTVSLGLLFEMLHANEQMGMVKISGRMTILAWMVVREAKRRC